MPYEKIKEPNVEGAANGFWNLDKHVGNLQRFGQRIVVAFNKYASDTDEEIEVVRRHCEDDLHVGFAVNEAFAKGGEGAKALAQTVVDTIDKNPSEPLHLLYNDDDNVESKIESVARNIYGAGSITYSAKAKKQLANIYRLGLEKLPVCIAKTQYSFSTNAKAYGPTDGFRLDVADIVINSGSGLIVAIAGNILRMPGLPKDPQANRIDVVDGKIVGLS